MRQIAVLFAVLSVGLLFGQFTNPSAENSSAAEQPFADNINLALRRTAHQLLINAGDSTNRIPPVQQLNATTFLIRLERPFDYGNLPALLQQSMDRQGITQQYNVSLLDCQSGEIQLGYSGLDFQEARTVPCTDRQQKNGCYNLRVAFVESTTPSRLVTNWTGWLIGFLLLGSAYVAWTSVPNQVKPEPSPPTNQIELGQTAFCLPNQSMVVAGHPHTLTYREAKLLSLFVHHPNQLLERDFILKSVWEDEGIIVGRSVDVFVSRLRKLLQTDSSLRIVAVHGVGYRLEVNDTNTNVMH
jgi:DNA-binding winged helix-turn-helix (wHTH) protein